MSVWTVSTQEQLHGVWNDVAIGSLGGKGDIARIWDKLKDDHMTGFPKRSTTGLESDHPKRQKIGEKSSVNC